MDIQEKYDAVNAMLKQFGNDPIRIPEEGSPQDKLQHLLDTYLAMLLSKQPRYTNMPNPRLIPDMILQYLYKALDEMA